VLHCSANGLTTQGRGRFAYVFYATTNTHAVAVLVALRRLQALGMPPDTDIVVLGWHVSRGMCRRLEEEGAFVVEAPPPVPVQHRYFRDSLLKLRAFQLVQYERIAFLDADGLPWSNLSRLLEIPFDLPVAMPLAYWLKGDKGTSALMVLRPSLENWTCLCEWLQRSFSDGHYVDADMGALNEAFAGRVHYLSPDVLRLDSDWAENPDYRTPGGDSPEGTHLIHFSKIGKPWFYSPELVRRLRPKDSNQFHVFWELWWRAHDDVVQRSRGPVRLHVLLLKYWHLAVQPPRAIARAVKKAVQPSRS